MRLTVMVCSVMVMILISHSMVQASMGKESLKGLKGVQVIVEDLDSDIEKDGLKTSSIKSDIEDKLRRVGITVLTEEKKKKTPGMPWLYISVSSGKDLSGLYIYMISIELVQTVTLVRDITIYCNASTWRSSGKIGTVDTKSVNTLRDSIKRLVDEFIFDYLVMNPKE